MMSRLSRLGGNLAKGLMVLAMMVCMFCIFQSPSYAQGAYGAPGFTLTPDAPELVLSFETPVGLTPALDTDYTTSVSGGLTLPLDFNGNFRLFANANYGFGDRGPTRSTVCFNDLWRGGIACDLGKNCTAYAYYEQRFNLADKPDRVMAGLTFRTSFRE